MRIEPTIGRVVWFRPPPEALSAGRFLFHRVEKDGRPLFTAQVVFVHDDGRINVGFMDHAGNAGQWGPVLLLQQGDATLPDAETAYCEWMPYQKGQAARTEQEAGGRLLIPVTMEDIKAANAAQHDLMFFINNRKGQADRVPAISQLEAWLKLVQKFVPSS